MDRGLRGMGLLNRQGKVYAFIASLETFDDADVSKTVILASNYVNLLNTKQTSVLNLEAASHSPSESEFEFEPNSKMPKLN